MQDIIIRRSTYSISGQPVAVRVSGDPTAENNGLFYIHSDHLGSTSILSDENGVQVGATTRYTPFGDTRTGGQSDITDRGFTGHRENRGIGLTYMNARYYWPGAGRFLSADTIVPDPTNPQSFNRYTYVLNSPLKYTDPSGHCIFAPPYDTLMCIGLLALALTADTPSDVTTEYLDTYINVANQRGIDPVVLAAVVRHESHALDRFFGDTGDRAIYATGYNGGYLSIGISQTQIRRAEQLENSGYMPILASESERVNALLNPKLSIEYAAAHLQYLGDEIGSWVAMNGIDADMDTINRVMILAYNLGWDDPYSNVDLLDMLDNSDDPEGLFKSFAQYGYVNEQVFSAGNLGQVERRLGLTYEN